MFRVKVRSGETKATMLPVRCPFYQSCQFGKRSKSQNKLRCYGVLIYTSAQQGSFVISHKCQRTNHLIMVAIKDGKDRHIKEESPEFNQFSQLLKPIHCKSCNRRALDAHKVNGEASIHFKCFHDGHEGQYALK